jgi:hypothetical protein
MTLEALATMTAKTTLKALVGLAMVLELQTSETDQILEANGRRNEAQS